VSRDAEPSPGVKAVFLVVAGLARGIRDAAETAGVSPDDAAAAVSARASLLHHLPLPTAAVCVDSELPWWRDGACS
jgi:hypothetical protein